MITDAEEVYVYVFDSSKYSLTDNAIKAAVNEYCKKKALSIPGESADHFLDVKRTKSGKPYLPNLTDIGISVSHSGKYLVCAVTSANVGVDIEEQKKHLSESDDAYADRLCKIAKRFFHPDEANLISTDPTYRFYEVFTAKESYVKFTGTGFDETMEQISILPKDTELPSCHRLRCDVDWEACDVKFRQDVFDLDYTLCICAEKTVKPVIVNME